MKQIKTVIAALLLSSAFICAQAANKEKNDDFKGYWNLHIRGGAGHTVGEDAFLDLISPTASFGFGYRITPVWGIRADFSGLQGKGALIVPDFPYSFNYAQVSVDAIVDLCSIGSYKAERVLNPYLLFGVGANARFGNEQAAQVKEHFESEYYWDGTRFSPAGRAGIGLDIRLCRAVALNIEVNTNILTDKFNSKKGSIVDIQNNALFGLKINFDKNKAAAPVATTTAAAATAASAAALAATEPKEESKPVEKKETVAKQMEFVKAAVKEEKRVDIFFTIGKWAINQSEVAKVNELIEYLKADKDAKVTVTGYADKDTGSAKRNMFLSQKRAETIAAKLAEAGISSDRITTIFKGSTEAPFDTPIKNRVAICIAK